MKLKKQFKTKGSRPTVYGVLIGTSIALLISILLSAAATSIIAKGKMDEAGYNITVFIIRAISVFTGAMVGTRISKEKYFVIIGIIAAAYTIVLVSLGIIIYDGSFQNFGTGVLSVLLGSIVGIALKLKAQSGRKSAKIRKM